MIRKGSTRIRIAEEMYADFGLRSRIDLENQTLNCYDATEEIAGQKNLKNYKLDCEQSLLFNP